MVGDYFEGLDGWLDKTRYLKMVLYTPNAFFTTFTKLLINEFYK